MGGVGELLGGWVAGICGWEGNQEGAIGTHDLVNRHSFRERLTPLILLSEVDV